MEDIFLRKIKRHKDNTVDVLVEKNSICRIKENDYVDLKSNLRDILGYNGSAELYHPRKMHFGRFLKARKLLNEYDIKNDNHWTYPKNTESIYVVIENGKAKTVKGTSIGGYLMLREATMIINDKREVVHCIDSISAGKPIFRILDSKLKFSFKKEHALRFAEIMLEKYQFETPDVIDIMIKNKKTYNEMKRIFQEIFIGKETIELDNKVFREFQYNVYEKIADVKNKKNYDELFEKQRKETFVETMNELDNMVGLNEVKRQFESLYKRTIADIKLKNEGIETAPVNNNALFLGNSGTGKTVVARMYANILWSLGVANKERILVEVSREDLISSVVGGSEKLTEKQLDEAEGGVFFLDEAYALFKDKQRSDFGNEILTAILRRMENDRENTVFVFAGYESEMLDLLSMNQGLESRMNKRYIFEDYSIEELTEIVKMNIEKLNFKLDDCDRHIQGLLRDVSRNGVVEGNARTARNISEKIYNTKRDRIADGLSFEHNIIGPSTIEEVRFGRNGKNILKKEFEDAKKQLDNLIGLTNIKNEVNNWINSIMVENIRFERGMKTTKPNLHMTFEGNPGTGKTIVARLIGKILKGSGILKQGQVVEVSRAELVGSYQGHTAKSTKRAFERARGGVLFIDEAYSLSNSERDTFGKEAIDTIIQEMENNRDNMVVIFAGYPREMDEFISINPGMSSRISKRFMFEDYNNSELVEIVNFTAKNSGYNLDDNAQYEVENLINQLTNTTGIQGNGRWAREFVERVISSQNNRIMNHLDNISDQDLINILDIDIKHTVEMHYRDETSDNEEVIFGFDV